MVKSRESVIFVDVFCLEHDLDAFVKFIGLWILNPLKTSGGQPVALGGFGVWLGGYFLARLIIFVFCENHVRELRTFFTVVLEPNIHTFSVLSETLPDFLKSKLC